MLDMAVLCEVFSGIDLNFETHPFWWLFFRLKAVHQFETVFLPFVPWRTEPRIESGPNGIDSFAYRFCVDLNQVDVFGVSGCRPKVQFKKRRSTAKRESAR